MERTGSSILFCAVSLAALVALPGPASVSLANSVARQGSTDSSYPAYPQTEPAADPAREQVIRRGEYLVKLGDCMACHTDTDHMGTPFAGGLKIATPFGDLFTPNITPDAKTGIGGWTDGEFVRAMREGVRPDGSYYYPVFPYNYFSKMSRDDVLSIRAYLDSIPPVDKPNQAQEMTWPFNYRFLQFGWRLLYFDFDEEAYTPDKSRSDAWNRGAFIVEGPGHCALCHTELNSLGVPRSDYYLAGAFVEDYYAPDITSRGLEGLDDPDVARIFSEDRMPTDAPLGGPMADVEHNSLRYLTHDDALAVANYLRSVQSESPPVEDIGGTPLDREAGKKLYESTCQVCHSVSAVGAPEVSNAQAWENLLNQGKDRLYEIAIRGDGVMPAKGGCPPCSDGRVKAAVDYMIDIATTETRKSSTPTR
ncbi:MAG: c-type cytochrome [Pseudomonadota bacterium]|nr:c-type cytochrome [Pseudomonadota bacterium]